ncbi:MAG: hypothetical protein HC890_08610 [Chloroflexaceae bacterium]|nr:hypothetical protein [Chloroflexaceae bacterium]
MFKKTLWLLSLALLSSEIFLPAAQAQQPTRRDDTTFTLSEIDCRSFLKLDDDERQLTMVFFHGFMSGKNNQTVFSGPNFAQATESILDYCISNPNQSLLSAFERFRSP